MLDRHDAEHRLANLVSRWVQAREEKSLAMREHNDTIKQIEEAIEGLSAEIQRGQYQPSLPLEAPADDGPTIFLAAEDEDSNTDTAGEDETVITTIDVVMGNPCLRCEHYHSLHTRQGADKETGEAVMRCSVPYCGCAGYVDSDPLGVADHNPAAEKGGDDATA